MNKDAIGQEVVIGDTVTFIAPRIRSLQKGIVKAFTPRGFRIEHTANRTILARPTEYVVKLK